MELSNILKQMAVDNELCQEHQEKWDYYTVDRLLDYYVQNPEWCIQNNYPGKEFILKNFSIYDLNCHGIYIDQDITGIDINKQIIMLHDCTGQIEVKNYDVLRAYMSMGNMVCFTTKDNSMLYVDMYDKSRCHIKTKDKSHATVYNYNSCLVTQGGTKNVKVVSKKTNK